MFSQSRRGRANASARPVKYSAIMDDFDLGGSDGGGGGSGKTIGVVLLMLIVAIGGILLFRGFERSEGEPIEPTEQPVALVEPKSEPRRDTPGLAERRNEGRPVIFDHPTMNGFKRYRVGSSETLAQIAEAFSANIAEVEKLNNVRSGTRLYAGQWLTIPDNRKDKSQDPEMIALIPKPKPPTGRPSPPVSAPPLTAPASKKPTAPDMVASPISKPKAASTYEPKSSANLRTYKVLSGDTAYRISLKYGITWQELLEFNGMEDPRELKAGQVLKIPD
ncbi:MAG: LysM peptidoglycan-binding domain-containing protein [Verrucomicrobiota bacterium]